MEEITPIEDNNINSIINLNENNSGGFATGIDYIGGRKPSKEVILPPIKKQTPPKIEVRLFSRNILILMIQKIYHLIFLLISKK